LDDVLRAAFQKSPELGRIDSLLGERLGEAAETRVKQNPVLGAELRGPTNRGGDNKEYEATVYQPLRISDFGFRSKLAALIRESASIEEKLALVEFIHNVSLTFAKTWAVQEQRGVLMNAQERARAILEKIRGAGEKGFLSEGDVAVFEGEVSLLSAEMVGAEADRKRALAELTRVSGAELTDKTLVAPPAPRLPPKDDVLREADENTLPAQKRAEILARVATKQRELARLDAFPRFSPGIGYERTGEDTEQVIVGFSIDLPFFDRNQAARRRALGAELAAMHLRDYATSGRLGDEAKMRHEVVSALAEQRRRFEEQVIPSRERALKGYRKQFDMGQGTAFQVWQAQRELTDTRLRVLDLWSQERTALAELGILLGTDL